MENEKDILLVTGATGHTARYFFDRLRKEKFKKKIKCLVRKNSKLKNLNCEGLKIDLVYGDFDNIESLISAMVGVETVLHIAGIQLSKNLLEAGYKMGVKWFICVHTTGKYSKFKSASSEYIKIERDIKEKYSNVTILRPTIIYGSKDDRNMWRLIKTIHKNKIFPIFGNGRNLFQPVNALDLGNSYFDVLQNKKNTFGKSYNLSGADQISYLNILKEISLALNKKIILIKLPNWFCYLVIYSLNKLPAKIYKCPINEEQVLRMREDKVFSHSKAYKDFGYLPGFFKDGIRREVKEFIDSLEK